jgi:hypothetical protein
MVKKIEPIISQSTIKGISFTLNSKMESKSIIGFNTLSKILGSVVASVAAQAGVGMKISRNKK